MGPREKRNAATARRRRAAQGSGQSERTGRQDSAGEVPRGRRFPSGGSDAAPADAACVTQAFPHWHGGRFWHHMQAGFHGHLVQVTDDFGELVAVGGRLCRPRRIMRGEHL